MAEYEDFGDPDLEWGSARSLASLFIEANTPKQAFPMSIEARWKH